ncbi:O-antigen ligase family protein [bacterium]|nr:MAG: O-antigen ligase family protein [bacterium]
MGTSRSRFADGPLWAASAAALLVPWTLAPGLRDAWVLPKCAAAAACAAAGLAAWAAAGAPSLALGLEGALAAFLAAAALASWASVDPSASWLGPDLEPASGFLGVAAAVAGLYLGAAAARLRADASSLFARAMALPAAAMGVLALAQTLSSGTAGWFGRGEGLMDRAVGTFGHPVALGAYLAVAAPYALAWALTAQGRARAASWAAFACVVVGLGAAGGRSAWAAGAAGCALALWLDGRPWTRRAAAAAAACGLAGALLLSLRLGAAGQRPGGRLGAWRIAWSAFSERPLAGWGPGSFGFLYKRDRSAGLAYAEGPDVAFPHAHNDWLEVLAATGLLGGAAYAWAHAAAGGAARRVWGPAGAAGLGGAAALFVQAKLNLPAVTASFLGAVGFGAAVAAAPAPVGRLGLPAALFVTACLAALALPLARFPAERADHLGRLARAEGRPREAAERLEAAVAGAPGVLRFRLDLLNLLWDAAEGAPPADREGLLARARDVALDGARLRPAEPEFARLLGLAELRRAEAGAPSLPAARAALEAARAADPFNPLTLRDLGAVAELEARGGRLR